MWSLVSSDLSRAVVSLKPGEYDHAIQEYKSKQTAQAYLKLAWIYHLYKADNKKAINYAMKALAKNPKLYKAHELLYIIYQMQGQYDQMFPHVLEMIKENRMENAIYLRDLIYLTNYWGFPLWPSPDQLKELEEVLKEKLRSSQSFFPVVQYAMEALLAQIYVESGRLEKAKEMIRSFGFVRDWLILGSFDNQQKMGFDEAYPPEHEIDLSRAYEGVHSKTRWRKLRSLRFDGAVDFDNLFQTNDWSAAYALTYVHSPCAQDAAVSVGSDDAIKVWLNDELILSDETYKLYKPDQHVIGIRLSQGWNKLLVKVCEGTDLWEFGLRVTDPQSRELSNIKYALDSGVYKKKSHENQKSVTVSGVEAYFSSLIKKKPNDERARYYLATWLKKLDRRDVALEAYENLFEINPNYARYYLEAENIYLLDGQPTKGLAALKKAVEIDPGYVQAHLWLGIRYCYQMLYEKSEKATKKALALNPNLVEALLNLGTIYEKKNRFEEAYRQAKKAVAINPYFSMARNGLGICSASRGFYQEAAENYKKALTCQYRFRIANNNLANLYRKQGKHDEAIKAYRRLLQIYDLSIDYYLGIADCYMRQKKYEAAIAECQKALAISPEHHQVYTKLGMIHYELGEHQAAKKHWETALRYKPDDMWLRDYLRNLFPTRNIIFDKYALDDQARKQILTTQVSPMDYPKAAGAILWDQQITQVFQDGSSTNMVHIIVKILSDPGREKFGHIFLPPNGRIKKAVTIKPDGQEVEPTDIQAGKISFAAADIGSIIEYEYVYDEHIGGWLRGHYYGRFYFQAEDAPQLYSEWVLALPEDKALKVHTQGDNIHHKTENLKGNKIHIWSAENLEQIHSEPYRPPLNDIASQVMVSTLPSWEFVAKWENSLVKHQSKIDSQIRAKIQTLTEGKTDIEDKIRAIYNYVAKEIRYLRREGEWIFGVKPQKAVNVFAEGYGVCKDKALLLIAMLNAIDIPAYFATLQTRDLGMQVAYIPFPWFNHVIVYVVPPDTGEGKFVDPTYNYTSYGDLWSTTQGVDALVIKPDGYEFIKTPLLPAALTEASVQEEIRIDPEGNIEVKGKQENAGNYAARLRGRYSVEGKRKELLEQDLSHIISGAELETYKFHDWGDLDQPLTIDYEYRAPAFARKIDSKMYFGSLRYRFDATRLFAYKSQRFYDILFYSKWMQTSYQEYVLPSGYQVHSLPENVLLQTDWAKYEKKYKKQRDKIVCERTFEGKVTYITKEDYPKFRAFCINVDAEERKEVVLSKK